MFHECLRFLCFLFSSLNFFPIFKSSAISIFDIYTYENSIVWQFVSPVICSLCTLALTNGMRAEVACVLPRRMSESLYEVPLCFYPLSPENCNVPGRCFSFNLISFNLILKWTRHVEQSQRDPQWQAYGMNENLAFFMVSNQELEIVVTVK